MHRNRFPSFLPFLAPAVLALAAGPLAARQIPAKIVELAPTADPRIDALVATLERERESLRIPGFALAIVQDDRLVLARGFGLADLEAGRAVTAETIFAIGSTSKAFTATLMGMLVAAGALGWDEPVTEHLPWFELRVDGKGPVTLRDLLAHRTGFGRMDVLWYGGGASAEEVLRTALRAEPVTPFRSGFLYNNVMYLAAGEVCAEVAGEPWEAQVHTRLLEPLGMRSTTTSVAAAREDARLALGYQWSDAEKRFEHKPMRDLTAIAPAGALNSNVLDLSRWVRFQLARGELEGRRLISAERLEDTWAAVTEVGGGVRYGLGWMLGDWEGERTVYHGGNIDGFSAAIWLLPSRGTGLALLANVSQTGLQDRIGPLVFAALHADADAPDAAASTTADPADLARFTGVYRASFFQFRDAAFTVTERDGKLSVDVPGQMAYELAPPGADGKRAFALVPDQIQVEFTEAEGAVVALVLHQGGMAFECFREGYEPPSELEPAEYEPYLGTYADPLTQKSFAVVVQHGRLAVDYPEQMVYELHLPKDDERWVFRATPVMAVEFQLDADGRAEALTFHERGTTRECERTDDPELPDIDEVLAVRRRRGEEFEARLAEYGACRLTNSLRFVHCGIQGTATTTFDPHGRFVEITDLMPFARTETRFDGTRGVANSSLEGERVLADASLDQARAGSPVFLFGDWWRRFDEVRLVRVEGENQLVRVMLRLGAAPPLEVVVDRATGDPMSVKMDELVDGIGTLSKTVMLADWREIEGLRLPMRATVSDPASGTVEYSLPRLEPGVDATVLGAR